jgi:glucan 1,3-beta-glucosidase
MGLANAERTLYYIRVLTEFISQSEYQNLIPAFGIINEALVADIGFDTISSFYLRAHDMIRSITGLGEGHGPVRHLFVFSTSGVLIVFLVYRHP